MDFRNRAVALCLLLLASTGAWCKDPRIIDLADIAGGSSLIGKRIIAATFVSDETGQPFADAGITFEGEVQADFTGKLSRRRVDDVDPEKYVALAIDRVANPSERAREDE